MKISTGRPNKMNISKKDVQGKCDLKCAYSFDYTSEITQACNRGIMIRSPYTAEKKPPVIFNTQNYNVSSVEILAPSIHLFNGIVSKGEVVIEHIPVVGGNNLYVCIPLYQDNTVTPATTAIKNVITTIATLSPSETDNEYVKVTPFTLQTIVPKAPFYSYSNSKQGDYIVFDIDGGIPMDSATLSKLQSIIVEDKINTTGNALFYNAKGPNSSIANSGIYISCKPTGNSTNTVEIKNTTNQNYDLYDLFDTKSPMFIVLMSIIGVGVFVILVVVAYTYFTHVAEPISFSAFKRKE